MVLEMPNLFCGHEHVLHRPFLKRFSQTFSASWHRRVFIPNSSCSQLPSRMQDGLLHYGFFVKWTFRSRIFCDQREPLQRVRFSHLDRPVVCSAQASNDPHSSPPSSAPQIPANSKLNGGKIDGNENSKESIMIKLKRYGAAGVLSYGLLNTVYYLGMFLFAWFFISPAPSGLGYRAAAERFIKLFALVWAGSQVTKILRAGCALALAPAIDRGLTWLTEHSRFQNRAEVFGVIVLSCCGIALAVFLVITFMWA